MDYADKEKLNDDPYESAQDKNPKKLIESKAVGKHLPAAALMIVLFLSRPCGMPYDVSSRFLILFPELCRLPFKFTLTVHLQLPPFTAAVIKWIDPNPSRNRNAGIST